MMERGNVFARIPADLAEERFDEIVTTGAVKVERIVSEGHSSPAGFWYDQDRSEWVLVLCGSAGLRFDDAAEVVVLKPGDWLNIPAHRKHRVEWTDPAEKTIWLAVHYDNAPHSPYVPAA